MNLLKVGNLLFQLGDFAIKAIASFADTDEGAKEWGDVVAAFVELDLFNPSDVEQNITVSPTSESEQPLTLKEIERIYETFNKAEEQVVAKSTASPPIVRNMPRKHERGGS